MKTVQYDTLPCLLQSSTIADELCTLLAWTSMLECWKARNNCVFQSITSSPIQVNCLATQATLDYHAYGVPSARI